MESGSGSGMGRFVFSCRYTVRMSMARLGSNDMKADKSQRWSS